MRKLLVTIAFVAALLVGCSHALVSNEYSKSGPHEQRRVVNKPSSKTRIIIRKTGDKLTVKRQGAENEQD